MVTKVEEVALAILAKVPAGYGMTVAEAAVYARAAIEEMRVPTSAMLVAASKECVAFNHHGNDVDMDAKDAADAYRAMIDAALNEKDHA